jgi:hypothetical protein
MPSNAVASLINISDDALSYELLPAPTTSTLPNTFGRMMGASSATIDSRASPLSALQRDTCRWPTVTYNHNYTVTLTGHQNRLGNVPGWIVPMMILERLG